MFVFIIRFPRFFFDDFFGWAIFACTRNCYSNKEIGFLFEGKKFYVSDRLTSCNNCQKKKYEWKEKTIEANFRPRHFSNKNFFDNFL